MANPFQNFARRLLSPTLIGELSAMLPEPVREALADVREYVAVHGRFPKLEPFRRAPLGDQPVQAVSVVLGPLHTGERLGIVNFFKGTIDGGQLRATNVVLGDLLAGRVDGVNVLIGSVRGGNLERVNLLVGDVHGGDVRTLNVLVGDVHGGSVQCQLLIGDIHGGDVRATKMHGTVHGGQAQVERRI